MIQRIGPFHVIGKLGAGAHSSILHIRREEDGREYALKVVPIDDKDDLKFLEQAKHEFRVGQMLDHPALVKIHALETESDWFFRIKKAKLLVEFIPGLTLDQLPLLPLPRMLRVFERIADGLTQMHKKGVFHADLKPNNLMLGKGTTVKVLDYGLAWIKGEAKDRVQGTPEYMAPETAHHKLINERTDIYNFGATMYRLATLKLPPCVVPMPGGFGMDEKMFHDRLIPVSQCNRSIPATLSELIEKCLNYNANLRPKRMSEIQGVLDRLADNAEADL